MLGIRRGRDGLGQRPPIYIEPGNGGTALLQFVDDYVHMPRIKYQLA